MTFSELTHPHWRRLLIAAVALPLVVVLAEIAFAWPSARAAPRDLPVGIVGVGAGSQRVVSTMEHSDQGAFDFTLYSDDAAAAQAIKDRDVYGALEVTPFGIKVLTASAASPPVAALLTEVGQHLAQQMTSAASTPPRTATVDVVAISSDDPRGAVLSSALLPLTICSIILAAVIALALGFAPAWRQVVALTVVAATAGLAVFLVVQTYLGALPGQHLVTWASISLLILSMSATTAGLVALFGPIGLGLGAALMVFVGNPFSAVTTAPELLPGAANHIGQWLPPGAGQNLLRSVAYFNGHAAWPHVAVLCVWAGLGLTAVFVGHHTFVGYAARQAGREADDTT